MVNKLIAAVFLMLCAVGAGADDETPPKKRPVIKKVIIEENAAWSDAISSDEPPESCKDFVLTESDVREFFKRARKASSVEYNHDLLMSRCYAGGRVVLQNGQEVGWEIDRARRGILVFPDRSALFFFCGKCRSKAYGEACDIDCIHAD